MPNFKEFIKGFEEKPEAKNPNPAPTPKPQEVKMEQPEQQLNVQQPEEATKTNGYKQKQLEYAKREKEADAKYKPLYDELEKKDHEIYTAYYYEQDPEKKAALKAQLDESDKKINTLLDEWEKAAGYQFKPKPKEGSFEQAFGGTSEAEEEKATQPDGYYKDDNEKIYMTKGGKDYYPIGEEEERDFLRAFANQNKEKAKEMANDPETAKSFERIYADLDKGFEETYKRKPTQEEKDAIRDIARLQAALVAMATKK